jgi:monovalent cation/hydrogen antiporter
VWLEHRIDDGPIEIAVSILVPYAAYLTAEELHASGVLAVVEAGLYLGRKSSEIHSPGVRLQGRAVWGSLEFILNGFVFVLIGLQLPSILAGVGELSAGRLLLYGALFSIFLILLRLVWTFPGAYVSHIIRTRLLHRDEKWPEAREIFVVGWTGMRGVIALAAAMSLPATVAGGGPFPHKDLIVFLTFTVILVTLVVQGLTLPLLIRLLGLVGTLGPKCEGLQARRLVLEAKRARLEEMRQSDPIGPADSYDDMAWHYEQRLANVSGGGHDKDAGYAGHYLRYLDLSRVFLDIERQISLRLRNAGRINNEMLREMEHEQELNETRLIAAMEWQSAER